MFCLFIVSLTTVSAAVHPLIEATVKPAACCSCAGQVASLTISIVVHRLIEAIVKPAACCSCAGQAACIQCIVSNCCTLHYQCHFQAYCPCAGQVAGASPTQVRDVYQELRVLGNLREGFVHRIGPEQLFKDLPAKHEHVVLLCLDAAQQAMYKAYLEVRPEAQDKL